MAVPLSEDARHAIAARLSDTIPAIPGKVVPPENWHLTIRFLGQTDEVTFDRVLQSLSQADTGGRFGVRFDSLGAFPNPRRAAVLWVGIAEGVELLVKLAEVVSSALETAGIEPEDRPFRAHLTLARIRPPESVERIVEVAPSLDVRMPVERVAVFRSHLGRPSPTYEEMESFSL